MTVELRTEVPKGRPVGWTRPAKISNLARDALPENYKFRHGTKN